MYKQCLLEIMQSRIQDLFMSGMSKKKIVEKISLQMCFFEVIRG